MGLFDMFGASTPAQKALKFKPKIVQKYGDPITRQGAVAHWLYIIVAGEAEVWLETPGL